jgi:putative PIN family toxin of toxin-antitoxin system
VRIVLDTTILVRANEHTVGLARELLLTIVRDDHVLLLSNEMLHELARVLRYPRLQSLYDMSEEFVYNYIDFLRRNSEIVTLDPLVVTPIRDANDIIVMQTAIAGQADILCTGDEDFFEAPAGEYLSKKRITVLNDVVPMHRLRSEATI